MQRKDQGLPILLYPLRFSVDNLSWPLRSGELCSRALGQNTGSRPPLGRRHGAGARRPARSAPQHAKQGTQAALGAQPRAATGVGESKPTGDQPPSRPAATSATAGKLCELRPARVRPRHPPPTTLDLECQEQESEQLGGRLQGGRETRFQSTVGYQLGHHGRREEYREGAETEWVWAGAAGERVEGGR